MQLRPGDQLTNSDGDEWVVVGGPEGCTAARPSWLAGDGPVSLVPSARRPADEKLTVRRNTEAT